MSGKLLKHGARPGDLITFFIELDEKWVVYVDNDEVVYLTLEGNPSSGSQRQPTVKCGNIWEVTGSADFEVNNFLDKECKPCDTNVIMKEARQMVGQKWSSSSTSCIHKHFVMELRYGKPEARQGKLSAKPGDLIEIFRGAFQHWAVYVGDEEVVHLTGLGVSNVSGQSSGQVTKDNIWTVVNQDKFKVNNLLDHNFKPREPRDIVKKACEMVGESVPYSLTSKNCEHFATELRYGKPVSRQVQRAVALSSSSVAAATGVGIGGIVAAIFSSR